jgi:ABC-type microcin C transport system permease subunit YejB
MLEVLNQDFIRTARAKGLPERVVIFKHALRNALIPIVTILGLSLPDLFGGAFIIETIFAWPGMGRPAGYNANSRVCCCSGSKTSTVFVPLTCYGVVCQLDLFLFIQFFQTAGS